MISNKPRLLDLFCGAGGAAKGYQRAGLYVVGVDNKPQPHYCGDEFYQADALTYPLEGYDAYHASPPCQRYSIAFNMKNVREFHSATPALVEVIRDLLLATKRPFIIENVPLSPLQNWIELLGMMFNLKIIRRRWFEIHGFELLLTPCPIKVKNFR